MAVCNFSGVLQGPECRKTFSNNPLLMERNAYYCSGLVTGMSLQQGDPGLRCLSPLLFDYFVAGPSSSRPIPLDVADHDMRKKIEKISEAVNKNQFDRAVREESQFIIECGISKINWDFSEKSELELLLCKI
ncbi:unnamed protein product [Porites evermanni]|uniref:Uncharacterized protein n=1 Tax=Porites evermanni TaxID=104178 RepID=A0ABN8SDH3_9CNID|nr:unnamed protein product [Porites evermanni]